METYKSDIVTINAGVERVFDRLTHPSKFNEVIGVDVEQLPQEVRDNLKSVRFEDNSMVIDSPMGPIKLGVVESVENAKVVYGAQRTPVPFRLEINLTAEGDTATQAQALIQLDIPKMLVPMVGGKLKEGAKKLGEVLARLPY